MKLILMLIFLTVLRFSASCQTGLSEQQAKALLTVIKKKIVLDSLVISQEQSINLLLKESNTLQDALDAKKQAYTNCEESLDLQAHRIEIYQDIEAKNKKQINRLKLQRWILVAFGGCVGYLLSK